MATASQFSDRGIALVRTFRAAFHALAEHKSDLERTQINEIIAAHLRSSAPMALLGVADTIEPIAEVIRHLADGARYELRVLDGKINLYLLDSATHDCDVGLTAEQAGQLRADLIRVMASGGVR